MNVQNAVCIGKKMLVEFEDALPDGFNKTLSKEIVIIGQHSNSSSPSKVTAKLDTEVIMT